MAPVGHQTETNQINSPRKRWSRNKNLNSSKVSKPDTAEERAKAWFTAYANWINYETPEEENSNSGSEANTFTVGNVVPNLRPETTPQPVPEEIEDSEEPNTPELPQEENVDFSED